eukprot:6620554-Prymnesium_polylepis.1
MERASVTAQLDWREGVRLREGRLTLARGRTTSRPWVASPARGRSRCGAPRRACDPACRARAPA